MAAVTDFEYRTERLAPYNPAFFARYASNYTWTAAPHLVLMSKYLEGILNGSIKQLMVFMPPRHGKSEYLSKYFPAFYLGRNPDHRVLLSSYEADFAATWGYKVRNLLQAYGPELFGVQVSQHSAARDRWDLVGRSGGMQTAGVGGALTGKGGHLLIIDDPVKNSEQARSKTYREKTYDWYRSTAYTRLEPGGAVIIIQTRWHDDDLSGRLLKEEPEKWTVLSLPALAEPGDLLGREPGEPLFPQRFNKEDLEDIKRTLGPYWFSALYQQKPQDDEGAIFKRAFFKYARLTGDLLELEQKKFTLDQCFIYQTCDPATSTKSSADYFVLGTWALTPDNDLVLLDLLRARLEGPDQVNLFWQSLDRWEPKWQFVEAVGVGKTLYQMLVREGLPVKELKADADKVSRAFPAAARMEAGTVYFLQGAHWVPDLEDELLSFPTGAHDDQVDVISYAVQVMIEGKRRKKGKIDMKKLIRTRKKG